MFLHQNINTIHRWICSLAYSHTPGNPRESKSRQERKSRYINIEVFIYRDLMEEQCMYAMYNIHSPCRHEGPFASHNEEIGQEMQKGVLGHTQ